MGLSSSILPLISLPNEGEMKCLFRSFFVCKTIGKLTVKTILLASKWGLKWHLDIGV